MGRRPCDGCRARLRRRGARPPPGGAPGLRRRLRRPARRQCRVAQRQRRGRRRSLRGCPAAPRRVRAARGPLFAFAAFGAYWGAWGVLVPDVKEQVDASVTQLGIAFLAVALAALPAMLVTGRIVDRVGPRILPLTLVLFGVAAVLPGLANSVWQLTLPLILVGLTTGAVDVVINVAATNVETSGGPRVMQVAHALFSAGFLVAAIAVGVAQGRRGGAAGDPGRGFRAGPGGGGREQGVPRLAPRGGPATLHVLPPAPRPGAPVWARLHDRGRDRELERPLPGDRPRRIAGGQRARARVLRRRDGRQAVCSASGSRCASATAVFCPSGA